MRMSSETAETQPERAKIENAMAEPCRKNAFAADNICSDCNKLSPLKFGRPRTMCRQVHHENWNRPSPGRNWGSDNVNVPSVAVKDETVMRRVWRRMTGVFDPEREGRAAPPDMSSRLEPAYSVEIGPNDVGISLDKARALPKADQALGLSLTTRRCSAWKPRARQGQATRPSGESRSRCRPASERRPYGRRGAGG